MSAPGRFCCKLFAALPTRNYRSREAGILNPICAPWLVLESMLRVGSLENSFQKRGFDYGARHMRAARATKLLLSGCHFTSHTDLTRDCRPSCGLGLEEIRERLHRTRTRAAPGTG